MTAGREPEIRHWTVLPAQRRPLSLRTADGLDLAGELAVPVGRPPVATTVWLHPLPTMGGSMDSHLLRKAANRLPALADLAVLRVNTRGTRSPYGASEGEFDAGVGERYDVAAAVAAAHHAVPGPVWLVGWSFGADLALRCGPREEVAGAVLLAPPLRFAGDSELAAWAAGGRPLTVVVPDRDDYLRPDAARARFAAVPQVRLVAVDAGHLFVGRAEVALDEVARAVVPDRAPLPRHWPPGPADPRAADPAAAHAPRPPGHVG